MIMKTTNARHLFRPLIGVALVCAAAVALCAATRADAAQQAPFPEIFVVNSTGDGDDAFPGDGQCETVVGNGVCTLRAAIEEANAHTGGDGIFFSIPTTDPGYSNGMWTINVPRALPDISDAVNISGPGADKLTVQLGGASAPLRIFNISATGTVNFFGITIARGQAPNDGSAGSGLRNLSATVNITKCAFVNDYVTAIHNRRTMNIAESTITGGNTASIGGGINNNGTLTIRDTTISGNLSGTGGGIWNNGTVNVIGCTISDNLAFADSNSKGGGIYNEITTGRANITGCTISGNTSSGGGGGIYNGAMMSVTNSTVSGNSSNAGAAIDVGPYGGTVLSIKSTIVALNTNNNYPFEGPDVGSVFFTSAGFNLIGKADGSTGFNAATDLTGTNAAPLNPKLGPLKDNGGPTYTMALLSGSPAIDKGTSNGLTGTLTIDQRGVGYARTINKSIANATGGDGTDIGAFEFGAQIKSVSRKQHGTAGTFDINLPLLRLGIECRKGGTSGIFKAILTFPKAVTVGSTSVTLDPKASSPTGSVSSVSISGRQVTVNLTGVSNGQTLHINLSGVSDGVNTNDISIPMGVLFGDTNRNGFVTSADATLTQSKIGQTLNGSNFREDVNLDGSINSTDVQQVQSKVGTKLP